MSEKNPLIAKVEEQVKTNPVIIYMKGTPEFPMCGFSARACQVLKAAGVDKLAHVNVLEDDDLWGALEEYSQWPTVPQIFINGSFVGGCDIVTEMYQRGELQALLKKS
jgi:monothiol glutaredoxin